MDSVVLSTDPDQRPDVDRASAVRSFTPREEYRPRHRADGPCDDA